MQGVAALLVPVLMALAILVNPGDLGDGAGFDPAGDSMLLMYPVLGALLMGSLTVATELSYDGSALWMQMSAGLRGRDDRWGRLVAFFWVFVPASVLVTVGFILLSGQWQLTLHVPLATLGALMVSATVGTVTGAVWQTPQPPPGQNSSPAARVVVWRQCSACWSEWRLRALCRHHSSLACCWSAVGTGCSGS